MADKTLKCGCVVTNEHCGASGKRHADITFCQQHTTEIIEFQSTRTLGETINAAPVPVDQNTLCRFCGSAPEDNTRCVICGSWEDIQKGTVTEIKLDHNPYKNLADQLRQILQVLTGTQNIDAGKWYGTPEGIIEEVRQAFAGMPQPDNLQELLQIDGTIDEAFAAMSVPNEPGNKARFISLLFAHMQGTLDLQSKTALLLAELVDDGSTETTDSETTS